MGLSSVDQLERLAIQARELGIVEEVWMEGDQCWLKQFELTYSCSLAEAIDTLRDAIGVVAARRARRVL